MAINLPSFRRQNLLIEYASLKHIRLRGIYVSLTPGDPSQWTGVLFVRKGVYAPAICRFRVFFPSGYPYATPVVTFNSDIFHPLITPLTTYTHIGTDGGNSNSAGEEVLPPGAMSLKSGFPVWNTRANSEQDAASLKEQQEDICVAEILQYIRQAFEEETMLDAVPLDSAVNQNAWYAWQAFRGRKADAASSRPGADMGEQGAQSRTSSRGPQQWKWEGVWEERVKRAVQSSLSEGTLFGSASMKDDEIHFEKVDEEQLEGMREALGSGITVGARSP